jgi:hypothetical protein
MQDIPDKAHYLSKHSHTLEMLKQLPQNNNS